MYDYDNFSSLKANKLVVGKTKGFLRGKALSVEGHVHDDRYFTESEMNTKLSTKFNYSGTTQNNIDMNTLTTQGTHIVLYASGINQTDLHTPWGETTSGYSSVTHYNLMILYCNNRITQIAYSCFVHNQGMWYRMKHDANWSKWYKVSIDGHTHDDRYYTEAEVNSKIQGVENMIQITMGGVKLVGSGSMNKNIIMLGSGPYTNQWQAGVTRLPDGDFMRIVSFPFSDGSVTGNFNEYIVLKSSSENYAILVKTDVGSLSDYGRGYIWYKNDNSIMMKVGNTVTTSNDRDQWYALFSYEIYKYQS